MATIKEIAEQAGVSTATVSRVLNNSSKVAPATEKKVNQALAKLEAEPNKSETGDNLTIQDVAREAGVSDATVSRVLNDSQNVAPATKKKVRTTIKELGYTPNLNARGLRSKETKLVGIIIPDISNSFFANIMKGVENTAHSHDYNVVLLETNLEPARKVECIKALQDRRADGMIYLGEQLPGQPKEPLKEAGMPVVAVSREEVTDFPTVNIDNYQAAYQMREYLIETGYQRIGFISGPLADKTAGELRFKAYKEALQDNGLDYNPDWVIEKKFILEAGYQAMQQILATEPQPEVVFAASDELAIGAMRAAKEAGLSIPADIGIAGFDDIQLARFVVPNLTTIRQPIYDLGQRAMEMLVKQIQGEKLEQKQVYLEHKLIVRGSS